MFTIATEVSICRFATLYLGGNSWGEISVSEWMRQQRAARRVQNDG